MSAPNLLEAALNSMDAGVVIADSAGRFVFWNDLAEKLVGIGKTDFLPDQWCERYGCFHGNGVLYKTEELPMVRALGGETVEDAEMLICNRARPEGVWLRVTGKPIQLGDGQVGAFVLLQPDDQRRRVERDLATTREFLDSIVENLPDMVFVKNADDLTFALINRAGEELLGVDRSEMLGKNDYDFFPTQEADFFTEIDRQVLNTKELLDVPEEPIETPQGTRWLHTKKIPIVDEHGKPTHLLGISEDITEWKITRDELDQMNEELRRSNEELEQFAYAAGHDLREPLRAITAWASRLETEYGSQLDERGREYIGRVLSGARRLRLLIKNLLELSRVTTRGMPFGQVNLDGVLQNVLEDLRERLRETDATVNVDELGGVWGDKVQFRQLFQNLLQNSLRYQKPDVPPVVHITSRRVGSRLEIDVADNGIGFDPKHSERMFQVFQTVHSRGETKEEAEGGVGMGLALCKRIVERHGGRISAQGTPGNGAKITVSLPLKRRRRADTSNPVEAEARN